MPAGPIGAEGRSLLLRASTSHSEDFARFYRQGDLEGAIISLQAQQAILRKLEDQQYDLISVALNLGFLNFRLAEANPLLADEYLHRAKQELLDGLLTVSNSDYSAAERDKITLLANLAHVLEKTGDVSEAERILSDLVDLTKDNPPLANHRMLSLELFYRRQLDYEKALNLALAGLGEALERQGAEEISTEVASYLSRVWRYHASLGQEDAAREFAERCREELNLVRSCLEENFYESEIFALKEFLKHRVA